MIKSAIAVLASIALTVLISFAAFTVGNGALGKIDGRLAPAAAPMTLLGHFSVPISDPSNFEWSMLGERGAYTAFWITSVRLRPECSWRAFDWYLGERGARSNPVQIASGPSVLHPDGYFIDGPWIANVHDDDFEKTYGDVLHQCFFTLFDEQWAYPWLTRTRFWN